METEEKLTVTELRAARDAVDKYDMGVIRMAWNDVEGNP